MTTADLLTALARECPKGVSFEPMTVRLLQRKVPFENRHIGDLKAAMFQLGSLWFSSEMILTGDSLPVVRKQIADWLEEYGFFSVGRLIEDFHAAFHHISTAEDSVVFLRHLGFKVSALNAECYFCILPSLSLDDALAGIKEKITLQLEESGGILTFQEIHQKTPNLTAEAMENIRVHLLQKIHKTEINETLCWCNIESLALPDDFAEKLTIIIDTLVTLKENITVTKLEFALNLFYCTRFREEYALLDRDTFWRICAEHYQGKNTIFSNTKKTSEENGSPSASSRVRSPNTRFENLGVPIGAKLTFTKNNQITCTVLNGINQVEYNGTPWIISSLAMDLLGVSPANGFSFFSYEGETLWDRRVRLEREGVQSEEQVVEMSPSLAQEEAEKIVGLSGKVLSESTWRAFRRDGTDSRVAEWVLRIDKGESLEQIAQESGYAVPTMKVMLSNHRLYFKVCELNGIAPEGGADV